MSTDEYSISDDVTARALTVATLAHALDRIRGRHTQPVMLTVNGESAPLLDVELDNVAGRLVLSGAGPAELRDHAAAEDARVADLARDAAQMWNAQRAEGGWIVSSDLRAALDRLADAYRPAP